MVFWTRAKYCQTERAERRRAEPQESTPGGIGGQVLLHPAMNIHCFSS